MSGRQPEKWLETTYLLIYLIFKCYHWIPWESTTEYRGKVPLDTVGTSTTLMIDKSGNMKYYLCTTGYRGLKMDNRRRAKWENTINQITKLKAR